MGYFVQLWLVNAFTLGLTCIILLYTASIVLDMKLLQRQRVTSLPLFALGMSLGTTALSLIDLSNQSQIDFGLSAVLSLVTTVGLIGYLKLTLPRERLAVPCLVLTLTSVISELTNFSALPLYEALAAISDGLTAYLVYNLLTFLISFLCLVLWQKTKLMTHFRRLLKLTTLPYAFSLLFFAIDLLFSYLMERFDPYSAGAYFLFASCYLVLLILLSLSARESERNHQLLYAGQLIQQQQIYLTHLESLHQGLQRVQHDYKNVLSGMYLQASEGRVEAIKDYLSDNLLSMDHDLQLSIKQQQQLKNIEMIELKSFFLTKCLVADEQQVAIELEIAAPVDRIGMNLDDFLRVLGIAIDNAIEAASETELATVSVLLLQEENQIQVIIKNPFEQEIDPSQIWEFGYSTKGPDRGIGLSNYRHILDKYGNVLSETTIANGIFTQTIMID